MLEALSGSRVYVVVGMHRSGTRLVADILASLGVFMGADRQGDSESMTFIELNEAIFQQCGTFWTEPLGVHVALADPAHADEIAAAVRRALGPRLARYLGTAGPGDLPLVGWKDPRNTFTLPVWERVFPELRVIHVLRHGVDAAASLARRQRRMCIEAAGARVPSSLAVFREHSLGVLSSRRGWTIHEAFAMWEQYVEKARLESARLGERALEVRFEDLLERPDAVIEAIARFCDTEPKRGRPSVDPARAYAFRREPALAAFAASVGDILALYGYSP
ncbi:MAG TPA: sulfotransferase [Gammaproteobacteria bacterium]